MQTDYRELMRKIETGLHALHADGAVSVPRLNGERDTHNSRCAPFAVIDEVATGGPAHTAGLQIGDKILSFGPVSGTDKDPISLLPKIVSSNVDAVIKVSVLRLSETVLIELIPTQWSGRGLLGCHITPTTDKD
eukprot:GHVR01014019.1.p1 GENE.GHVR01014019.1~~GHVR01014019.1.p1  ORF type:complete len:134 (+),score=28.06 GHVR01014019.1:282-683(+)